ncbi:hypothetical protein P43SY_008129 [Pythium insidiosum]|uniref:Uncharacterized protein n=1 Tax=Pythium insidiosum TaxID=114742 RepID=A0AAD5Q846_PYTIN|nr:hypothetical protein P43SY_008129 [Pythium insidiosum]
MQHDEIRMPLGVLNAGDCARDAGGQSERQVDGALAPQRLAVCERSRLVAVANGRIIDLFLLDALTSLPSHVARDDSDKAQAAAAHLPFVGQIALDEYAPQDAPLSAAAACVRFIASAVLLVAFELADADVDTTAPTATRPHLAAFRLFPSRRVVSARPPDASLLVHCCFVDRVQAPVADMHVVAPSAAAGQQDAGAVVLLHASGPLFSVLHWRERLADRELVGARLPGGAAALTAADVSPDGQWLALGDGDGGVWLLDCRGLAWGLRLQPATDSPPPAGTRLELVVVDRLCQRAAHSRSGMERVRLAHCARLRHGVSSLRWLPTPSVFLAAGQRDGALAVLAKTEPHDSAHTLRLVQTYPALAPSRAPVASIVATRRHVWSVGGVDCRALPLAGDAARLRWPTLRQSLEAPSSSLGRNDPWRGGLHVLRCVDVLEAIDAALGSRVAHAAVAWLTLRRDGLCLDAIRLELGDDRAREQERERDRDQEISETAIERDAASTEREDDSDAAHVETSTELSLYDAETTVQRRYGLPSIPAPASACASLAEEEGEKTACPSTVRLTKDEYERRLVAMARRVDRLQSQVHGLRRSFQLFMGDVQQHMALLSAQLEDHAQAECARLDDSAVRERRAGAVSALTVGDQRVVPHVRDKYDPSHPDADWAGVVSRAHKTKKTISGYSAGQSQLVADERGGLMPATKAAAAPTSFSGKKMFEPHEIPAGDAVSRRVDGIAFSSAVYQVGPGGDLSCRDWKTSYEAQTSMEATPKDTFVLGSRHNAQHKRHVTPMSVAPQSSRSQSPAGLASSDSSGSLSGRRAYEPRRSLLAGIGKLVATEDTSGQLTRPELHLPQSYADPNNKTLLPENHHGVTLGYTGLRSSFRR